MIKLTIRKGFNFFRSYYDVYNELNNKDKLQFIDALLNKQFHGIDPTNLTGQSKFAYISQMNSINSQVKGYEDKTGTILTPTVGGSVGGKLPPTLQGEEKGEEKGEGKEEEKDIISFVDYCNDQLKINGKKRNWHVSDDIRKAYKNIIKQKYTKDQIAQAINEAKRDPFHKDNNYKYLTPLYFTRQKTLVTYGC